MKKTNKKGFTLIELIVVIAILAILAMILVPSLTGYISKSKTAVANANARSCYTAGTAAQANFESGLTKQSFTLEIQDLIGDSNIASKCAFTAITGNPGTEGDYNAFVYGAKITKVVYTDGDITGTFEPSASK